MFIDMIDYTDKVMQNALKQLGAFHYSKIRLQMLPVWPIGLSVSSTSMGIRASWGMRTKKCSRIRTYSAKAMTS